MSEKSGSGDTGSTDNTGSTGKKAEEPEGGRPGPEDHGREGGMATREIAPELTEPDSEG